MALLELASHLPEFLDRDQVVLVALPGDLVDVDPDPIDLRGHLGEVERRLDGHVPSLQQHRTRICQAIVGIMAVFAQLRVDTIRQNTRRGLAYARAHGRTGGRPTVMGPERTDAALRMKARGESTAHIAVVLGVSPSSVRRALNRMHTRASSR